MRNTIVAFVVLAFAALPVFAQEGGDQSPAKPAAKTETLHGYVVDAMCASGISKKQDIMQKAAGHTRACAMEESCTASGFGVFSDSKYYKFDDAGDKLAKSLIEKTKTGKGIMVEVTGVQNGERFAVASIKETKAATKAAKPAKGKKSSEGMEGMEGMH